MYNIIKHVLAVHSSRAHIYHLDRKSVQNSLPNGLKSGCLPPSCWPLVSLVHSWKKSCGTALEIETGHIMYSKSKENET